MAPKGKSDSLLQRRKREKTNAQAAHTVTNPFNLRKVHKKRHVLGQKVRVLENTMNSVARSQEIRKKTLVVRQEKLKKSNAFIDKRIGEKSSEMTQDEKMLARMQVERTRRFKKEKKSIFNLDEDDDEHMQGRSNGLSLLTHLGKDINSIDNFDDYQASDDDQDDEDQRNLNREITEKYHFGGPSSSYAASRDPNAPKTREDIMKEIISKSKAMKFQSSRDKEDDKNLIHEINEDLKLIMPMLEMRENFHDTTNYHETIDQIISTNKPLSSGKQAAMEERMRPVMEAQDSLRELMDEKNKSYERIMGELRFEPRATATQRVKTSEEKQELASKKLQMLERERLRRMNNAESAESLEVMPVDLSRRPSSNHVSADSLQDDFTPFVSRPEAEFEYDNEFLGIDDEDEDEDEDEEEEFDEDDFDGLQDDDDDEEGDSEDNDEDEDEDGDDSDEDDDSEEEDSESEKPKKKKQQQQQQQGGSMSREEKKFIERALESNPESLPFVIPVPKSLSAFKKLLSGKSSDDKRTVVSRIISSNNVSLNSKNKEKLQEFAEMLVDHFEGVGSEDELSFDDLDTIGYAIFQLTQQFPDHVSLLMKRKLQDMEAKISMFFQDSESAEKLLSSQPSNAIWSLGEVFLLKLVANLFPTSDFQHCITTPATVLMTQYLEQIPTLNSHILAVKLFLCSLLHHYHHTAEKFLPEVISFLESFFFGASPLANLHALLPPSSAPLAELLAKPAPKAVPVVASKNNKKKKNRKGTVVAVEEKQTTEDAGPVSLPKIFSIASDDEFFSSASFRSSMITIASNTLSLFATLYKNYQFLPELFQKTQEALAALALDDSLSPSSLSALTALSEKLDLTVSSIRKSRKPMMFREVRVTPMRMIQPKFHQNFNPRYDYDENEERKMHRVQRKKKINQTKGAVREIRKDNAFLAHEKMRRIRENDKDKAEKMKSIQRALEDQSKTINLLERMKPSKKK